MCVISNCSCSRSCVVDEKCLLRFRFPFNNKHALLTHALLSKILVIVKQILVRSNAWTSDSLLALSVIDLQFANLCSVNATIYVAVDAGLCSIYCMYVYIFNSVKQQFPRIVVIMKPYTIKLKMSLISIIRVFKENKKT